MRWHYDVVSAFYEDYYRELLTENTVTGDEMHIVNVKDREGDDVEVADYFYTLKKDNTQYLLKSEWIRDLPILVKEYEKASYRGKAYRLIKKPASAKFRAEHSLTFKEMVDTFADYGHSQPNDFKLAKILVMCLYLDRNNIRMSSQPAFGKDSLVDLFSYLTGNTAKVSNPTIAKLKYLVFNKLVMINEVGSMKTEDIPAIEAFFLDAGAFSNKWTNSSRGTKGIAETSDINHLSILATYNDLDCYSTDKRYFDYMFKDGDAIKDRFLPFKMRGQITEQFGKVMDLDAEVKKNHAYFVSFIRSLMYYSDNVHNEVKPYSTPSFGLKGRWGREFGIILPYLNLYAESEEEYHQLAKDLYERHTDYLKMVQRNYVDENSGTLNAEFVTEEPMVVEEEFIEDPADKLFNDIKKADKGDGVLPEDLGESGWDDNLFNKLVTMGRVFNSKGRYKVLE